jgi:hypothetical protein
MTAPARGGYKLLDLQLCEGCSQLLPRELLCPITAYCASCLDEVIAQDEQSRRELALRTLAADLRRIGSLTEADVATITAIVRRAWA